MSLSEKYQLSLDRDKAKKENEETLKKFHEERGLVWRSLDSYAFRIEPINLPSTAKKTIMEAIPLIKSDKWAQANLHVTRADVKEESSYLTIAGTGYSYVKYKHPNGKICIGKLDSVFEFQKYKLFIKNRLVQETNKKYERLVPHLYGSQRYVILDFFRGFSDDSQSRYIHLILFEDGFIFYHPSHYASYERVCFDNNSISEKDGDYRVPLDDWLVSNLKRINTQSVRRW